MLPSSSSVTMSNAEKLARTAERKWRNAAIGFLVFFACLGMAALFWCNQEYRAAAFCAAVGFILARMFAWWNV
jgi:hypothetical protein